MLCTDLSCFAVHLLVRSCTFQYTKLTEHLDHSLIPRNGKTFFGKGPEAPCREKTWESSTGLEPTAPNRLADRNFKHCDLSTQPNPHLPRNAFKNCSTGPPLSVILINSHHRRLLPKNHETLPDFHPPPFSFSMTRKKSDNHERKLTTRADSIK